MANTNPQIYNRIYNDDDWENVNKDNKNIMEDFLLEIKSQKKKETTLKQYRNDLRIILIYIYKYCNNECILNLSKRDFRNFSLWTINDCAMSSARTNRLLSCARSLLSFCEEDDEYDYDVNCAKKVKGISRESIRDVFFLKNEEVLALKDELIKMGEYQKATLVMLLYDSSCRKNEISQVQKFSFLDQDKNVTNKVVGKRGKIFNLLYFSGTKQCVALWLEQRGNDDIPNLFVVGKDENKRAASPNSIYNWITSLRKLYLKLFNKSLDFNVHSFRHLSLEAYSNGSHYVCKELNLGAIPIEKLRLLANHSDISTTNSYLRNKDLDELENLFGIKIEE